MEVKATARYVRMSPRKVRLVVDLVRGMPIDAALTQLRFLKKAASLPVYKVIASAAANAEHNFGMKREALYVKTITADSGPTFHRWTPKAFGRAAPIRKRSTHIQVVLAEKEAKEAAKPEAKEPVAKKKAAPKKTATTKKKKVEKTEAKTSVKSAS